MDKLFSHAPYVGTPLLDGVWVDVEDLDIYPPLVLTGVNLECIGKQSCVKLRSKNSPYPFPRVKTQLLSNNGDSAQRLPTALLLHVMAFPLLLARTGRNS